MSWLVAGVVYSLAYAAAGLLLRDSPTTLSWFRAAALLVLPMTAALVIVRRRQIWTGCHWLFWSTIALGLTMSAIGLTGWATDEVLSGRQSWLAWPAVFALFGNLAPLYALMAQPHRGTRERLAASTSVDIASLAVVTGFLYSFFVTDPGASPSGGASTSLLVVSDLQAALVAAGLVAATFAARGTPWGATYRRLALGSIVGCAMLTLSNLGVGQTDPKNAFIYDLTWMLPFAFFAWAASESPASPAPGDATETPREDLTRPRPWAIFVAVGLLPVIDFVLRQTEVSGSSSVFRDLSSAVAIVSVLPLLVARIAVERAEMQQASGTTRLLAEVIEQTQDCIIVLMRDGRFRHANEAFCRTTGFSRDELQNMSVNDLLPSGGLPGDASPSALKPGTSWRGTVTRRRRDGTTYPAAASVACITDNKDTSYLVSVERDISEERRLREQLIHSERLSAVGQLVAGVAHELNNPLQTVIGLAELLTQSASDEASRQDLEQMRVSGLRAAHIVRSLLAFVHRSTSQRRMVDLNEIVRSTVELRAFEMQRAQLVMHEAYAEPAPLVIVSREEIQQVVFNVLMNAEQAIRSGGGSAIQVRTGGTEDVAFVEITDDGPGVPHDLRGRIFEPFFTTKEVGSGTGLGLSIGLGIAEAHGGGLTLVRTERGACFKLTLPSLPSSIKHEVLLQDSDTLFRSAEPIHASSASE